MKQLKSAILACGALAHELVSLKKLYHWHHLQIKCLPASLHNTPQLIAGEVRKQLEKMIDQYDSIYVAYADCGTGGQLDHVLDEYGVERLPGAHCYEFFAGSRVFTQLAEAELGTFYLTDFLVRHFDRIILRDLGLLKHPELFEMYFKNYRRVLYLDQTGDPLLQEKAQKAADKLGLEYQTVFTGLEQLAIPVRVFFQNQVVPPD